MFLHDYLLACEISIVRTLDLNRTRDKTSNFQRYLGKWIHISQSSVCMKSSFHQLTTCILIPRLHGAKIIWIAIRIAI